MIGFILLIVIAAVVLGIRNQSERHHRELLAALNPEKLRQMDEEKRAADRQGWINAAITFGIIICFGLLIHGCQQIAKFMGFGHDFKPATALSQGDGGRRSKRMRADFTDSERRW
jgi:hypothetical protein